MVALGVLVIFLLLCYIFRLADAPKRKKITQAREVSQLRKLFALLLTIPLAVVGATSAAATVRPHYPTNSGTAFCHTGNVQIGLLTFPSPATGIIIQGDGQTPVCWINYEKGTNQNFYSVNEGDFPPSGGQTIVNESDRRFIETWNQGDTEYSLCYSPHSTYRGAANVFAQNGFSVTQGQNQIGVSTANCDFPPWTPGDPTGVYNDSGSRIQAGTWYLNGQTETFGNNDTPEGCAGGAPYSKGQSVSVFGPGNAFLNFANYCLSWDTVEGGYTNVAGIFQVPWENRDIDIIQNDLPDAVYFCSDSSCDTIQACYNGTVTGQETVLREIADSDNGDAGFNVVAIYVSLNTTC